MGKQRMVDTCFWDDGYIMKLDPSEKLLFLYLLTNPLTNISGVYQIELRRISFDTGFESETVNRMMQRFERDGKCIYRDGWLAMKNWIKHQTASPKVQIGIDVLLQKVPAELAEYVIGYPIDTTPDLNPNLNPNSNSTKSTTASEMPLEAAQPVEKKSEEMPFLTTPDSGNGGLIAAAKYPKPTKQDRDPRIRDLIKYFSGKFKERKGFDPTVNWGAWGSVFKRLLRDSTQETVEVVIDTFFEYDKRFRFSIFDFEKNYDSVYGYLHEKINGKGGRA